MKLAYPFITAETNSPLMAFRGDEVEVFPKLKDLGYTAIELLVRDPKQIDRTKLEKALNENLLQIASVSTAPIVTDDNLTFTAVNRNKRKEAIKRVKTVIDFAAGSSSPVIIGKIRGNLVEEGKETSFEWMRQGLQESGEYAAKQGVELAIEPQNEQNINVLNTAAEVLELIESLQVPSLKIMLDTYHLYVSEDSIHTSLRAAQEKLIFMHFSDENRALSGQGVISFADVLKTLSNINYTGYISMEIKQYPSSYTAAKMAIEHISADI